MESRFWGTDDIGYWRVPFIWLFAMALGSMKLEPSYMPFCGDWKSIARVYPESSRSKVNRDGWEGRKEVSVKVQVSGAQ